MFDAQNPVYVGGIPDPGRPPSSNIPLIAVQSFRGCLADFRFTDSDDGLAPLLLHNFTSASQSR